MATVLVIDDDQTSRTVIGIAVEEIGHQATYALDGEEAVQMIKANAYDVVFMDLAMPNKNGLIAIQEIIEEFPGTKIVAVSGKDTEMLERAVEYGALKALTKPITPKQVQDAVEDLLQTRPTGGWDDVME
ncbi:MAG: response regulator [Gemmatimonadetes bacterium]|nr:response regulator [Gemmatimonadota bacterium]MCH8937086.1 response regulator [Gemmatimonadota bacterium]